MRRWEPIFPGAEQPSANAVTTIVATEHCGARSLSIRSQIGLASRGYLPRLSTLLKRSGNRCPGFAAKRQTSSIVPEVNFWWRTRSGEGGFGAVLDD